MPRKLSFAGNVLVCLVLLLQSLAAQEQQNPIAQVEQDAHRIVWMPTDGYWEVTLRIIDSVGVIAEETYLPGQEISFTLAGLPDGSYNWELLAQPTLPSSLSSEMKGLATESDRAEFSDAAKRSGDMPLHSVTQSGSFTIEGGLAAMPDLAEVSFNEKFRKSFRVTVPSDQSVQGSQCVGLDCPNNPSYGFTTLLLMENNLRIKFDDTSNSASFPNNDWGLEANETTNGGRNAFFIRDCGVSSQGGCGGNAPFTIEAGAPNNAFYLDDGGRVGMGTMTPVVEMHINDGDTPTMRLQQTNGSGFQPQVWDIAGNETNFFVRDVTNGSSLPFKVFPGAADNTLILAGTDRVGIGTTSPLRKLHINAVDDTTVDTNTTALQVQNGSLTEGNRAMVQLVNNGGAAIYYEDTSSNLRWQTLAQDANFFISRLGSGGSEFTLTDTGNLTITGNLTQMSDRNAKRDIEPVDVEQVLNSVKSIPIATWSYKKDEPGVRHMGPMAQDFHAAFGLGPNERYIATLDTSGVALAAIQALSRQIEELKAKIAVLEAERASDANDE